MSKIKEKLKKYDNGLQQCNGCKRKIPADVDRISFGYSTQWGSGSIRICSLCFETLHRNSDKKALRKWKRKLVVEEI